MSSGAGQTFTQARYTWSSTPSIIPELPSHPASLAPTLLEQNLEPAMDRPTSKLFRCKHCERTFPKQCLLTRHLRNHTKPLSCQLCPSGEHGVAQFKDLHRHYWSNHRLYAEENMIPKEWDNCPNPNCDYEGRKDNVKRHQKIHNA